MAMMFPERLGPKATSSEGKVWEQLATLPEEWSVIRTKRFSIPSRLSEPVEGEIDYLVIDPARGCIGLEIIEGRPPRWVENTWFQPNDQGYDVEVEPPGKRARLAVHKLSQYLGTQPAFRDWKRHPSFGWGVVLPASGITNELVPDLSRNVTIDKDEMLSLQSARDAIYKAQAVDGPPIDEIRLDVLIGILTKAS
jgi:hypothetical protein